MYSSYVLENTTVQKVLGGGGGGGKYQVITVMKMQRSRLGKIAEPFTLPPWGGWGGFPPPQCQTGKFSHFEKKTIPPTKCKKKKKENQSATEVKLLRNRRTFCLLLNKILPFKQFIIYGLQCIHSD